jgi:acyl carrier protein
MNDPRERVLTMLRTYVEEDLKQDPNKVSMFSTLEDMGVDSLQAIEFVFKLEEEFKIRLDAEELKNSSVESLVALIERQLRQPPAVAAA